MLDLIKIPFSRADSWLSLAVRDLPSGTAESSALFLRTNHGRPVATRELFQLRVMQDGLPTRVRIEADVGRVRLHSPGGGLIEIALESAETCRVRGFGSELHFLATEGESSPGEPQHPIVTYPTPEGVWIVNLRRSYRRYAFGALSGDVAVSHEWSGKTSSGVTVQCHGSPRWEVRIDGFQSTCMIQDSAPFDLVTAQAERDFQAFCGPLPTVPAEFDGHRTLAAQIMWFCLKSPLGLLRRRTMLMSLNWMDAVWSWDNLFNAMALMPGHAELAAEQIACITDHQDENGAYPDNISDLFLHYNFAKPPVQGVLFTEARRRWPAWWTEERSAWILDTVGRFTRWWLQHRLWGPLGLAYYLHGNDSGWDNTTLLNSGTPLIAPDLNALLIRQCDFLAELAQGLDRRSEADEWRRERERLRTALLKHLWRENQFVGLKMPEGTEVRSRSLIVCLPIVLAGDLPAEVERGLVQALPGFLTEWGLASEHPDSPLYESDGYWRGPIWGASTYLIVLGLRRAGETRLADEIARRYCRLCAHGGFAENFDARSGAPLRDPAYTWTASVFLLLGSELTPNAADGSVLKEGQPDQPSSSSRRAGLPDWQQPGLEPQVESRTRVDLQP
jgi:hypothetical protein